MSLHIESTGRGRDLFLLHGWGMHGGVWEGVSSALADGYRVHAVDLPGMGYSAACTPYTLERLAQVIAAEVPEASMICGWSLGGQVAMRLALDFPHKVSRLMLVGTTPKFVRSEDWQVGMDAAVFRQFAEQVAADYQATMSRFLGLQAFGGESSRELIRQLREKFCARSAPDSGVLRDALDILLKTDLRAQIGEIRMPVLLVHGDRDTLAPVGAARWLVRQLPQASLQVIAGASHAPFLSHPTAYLQATKQFLE